MYVATNAMPDVGHIIVETDISSNPITIKFRHNEYSGSSEVYLSISIELADQLQAKLASAIQDYHIAQEDINNKHKEQPQSEE